MTVCPHCSHINPPQAQQCQACYNPLNSTCPGCGATVILGVRFCDQCGLDLHSAIADPSTFATGGVSEITVLPESSGITQLQVESTASLLHLQTQTALELSPQLGTIHIGKPNNRVPPDIDVSGFPKAEIVSRVHASLHLIGDTYYIEDSGSSNGTYVNGTLLSPGQRQRLRSGDRIALGKGDNVTFVLRLQDQAQ